MRLYLRDEERRPDPPPVETDDRKAILVGFGAWVLALAAVAVVSLVSGGVPTLLVTTCMAGFALGVCLLVYTERRRRR